MTDSFSSKQGDKAQTLGLWGTVGMAFFIPIAPAPANFFYVLAVLSTLISSSCRQRIWLAIKSPAATALVAMYGVMLLWIFVGPMQMGEATRPLTKYLEWLFIPLLASVFSNPRQRAWPIFAFQLAMAITLILSFGFWFRLLDWWPWLTEFHSALDRSGNAYVFKLHITQNVFMALAAFLALHVAWLRWRGAAQTAVFGSKLFQIGPIWLWTVFGLVGLYNVFFMVEGRTGWLVVAGMLAYWLLHAFTRRPGAYPRLLLIIMVSMLAALGAYKFSGFFHDRVHEAIVEAREWQPAVDQGNSSLGLRMTWWYYSVKAIQEKPLLGAGTGSFERVYSAQAAQAGLPKWDNPHQQFLLFWVEFGLVGLIAFLMALAVIYKNATPRKLDTAHCARALILAYCAANLFNSLHLDFAEGLLFALAIAVLAVRPEATEA